MASYRIFPLGDAALTIDFGNLIDEEINRKVIALFRQLQQKPLRGMIEAIPAYSSLTIFYDLFLLKQKAGNEMPAYEFMKQKAEEFLLTEVQAISENGATIRIPVCYDEPLGIDLKWIAEQKNISVEEIISIHCSKKYRVYMLGFLPGFAYMGEVDEKISVPRKKQPEKIFAGSVGIAGKQTGIYPFDSPGGWQIIGRTPLRMFDENKSNPCYLKAGDQIEFYPITIEGFQNF